MCKKLSTIFVKGGFIMNPPGVHYEPPSVKGGPKSTQNFSNNYSYRNGEILMETTRTAITPVKQAFVEIAGHTVLAFLLPDGRIAAAFRMICNILGISHRTQVRSVQANPTIADLLLLVKIEIVGTPQEMNVIIAEAIPMWLASIHESKVAPEARETLEEFQRVAVQTLRAFFFPEEKTRQQSAPPREEAQRAAPPQPEPAALPEPDPLAFPPLGDEARYAYWEDMVGAHAGLERHLRAIDALLAQHSTQLAETRQTVNQHAALLEEHLKALMQHREALAQHREQLRALKARADGGSDEVNALAEQVRQLEARVSGLAARLELPSPLTAEHLGEARGLVQALAHQTGQPASALERELAAAFGVKTLHQLSEAAWSEIAAWLRERLGW
jgi:hypothetical protein